MMIAMTCTCGFNFAAEGESADRCPVCVGQLGPTSKDLYRDRVLPDDLHLGFEPRAEIGDDPPTRDEEDDGAGYTFIPEHADLSDAPGGPYSAWQGFWAPLGSFQLRTRTTCLAYGSHNRLALVGHEKGVQILNMRAHTTAHSFNEHCSAVTGVALAADERFALSGDADGNLFRWELHSRRVTHRFRGHTGAVRAIAISADGNFVISGGADGAIRLWNLAGGGACRIADTRWREDVTAVTFSDDDRYLLAAGSSGRVDLWALASGICLARFRGANEPIGSVRCENGIVTAAAIRTSRDIAGHARVWHWNRDTGHRLDRVPPRGRPALIPKCTLLDRDGKRLIVAGRVPAFDPSQFIPTPNARSAVTGVLGEVRDAVRDFFSFLDVPKKLVRTAPSRPRFAVEVWSLVTGNRLHAFPALNGAIEHLAVSPENTRILATSAGALHVYAIPAT